jgi:hypothetical protein
MWRYVWWASLVVSGCGVSKGNCIPDEYYLGPSFGPVSMATNGGNIVVTWHILEERGDQRDLGALFDPDGRRIAGSEFELPDPYFRPTFAGAPDRALAYGIGQDLSGVRPFYAIQLASGELSTPIEPGFRIRSAIYEGPGFLLATDQGLARVNLDGEITEEITLAHPMETLVGGATVSWALENVNGTIAGIRIARNGAPLDTTPKPIMEGNYTPMTASRGDETIVARFAGDQLTWSVLGANGTVTTTTAPTATGVTTTSDSALVAERDGYLLFLDDSDTAELGTLRISPAGVPGEYVAIARTGSVDAAALGDRVVAAYARVRTDTLEPGVDAVVVENAAPPSAPITLEEDTSGHIEQRTCHWYD